MNGSTAAAFILAGVAFILAGVEGVIATAAGRIRGVHEGGVWAFRGVPYARAPVAGLRWRPPEPPAKWSGIREARAFGPIAPQSPPSPVTAIPGDTVESDEDCLSLNVWTPALDGRPRPVMVWLHGGGFTSGNGASSLYDPTGLVVRGDVVVVSLNYRLGALGFLAHEGLASGGGEPFANWGLLDQIAALEWVRDAIGELGGDPGNVTIFGESAGAMSVATLMAMPGAHGLFARAVVQSGPPVTGSTTWGERQAEKLCELLGLNGFKRGSLAAVAAPALVEAGGRLALASARSGGFPLPFLPVVDGVSLPAPPGEAMAEAAPVPLLIGTNRDECAFFTVGETLGETGATRGDACQAGSDRTAPGGGSEGIVEGRLARLLSPEGLDDAAGYLVAAYRSARAARGESCSDHDLWTALLTDLVFRVPSLEMAAAHSERQAATFVYMFDQESPILDGLLGSCHGLEIPFVFGSLANPVISIFAGKGPEAAALSSAMGEAWVAFARDGDPSCDALGEWPGYDAARRSTMVLGPHRAVEDDPRSAERMAWHDAGVDLGAGHHYR